MNEMLPNRITPEEQKRQADLKYLRKLVSLTQKLEKDIALAFKDFEQAQTADTNNHLASPDVSTSQLGPEFNIPQLDLNGYQENNSTLPMNTEVKKASNQNQKPLTIMDVLKFTLHHNPNPQDKPVKQEVKTFTNGTTNTLPGQQG